MKRSSVVLLLVLLLLGWMSFLWLVQSWYLCGAAEHSVLCWLRGFVFFV